MLYPAANLWPYKRRIDALVSGSRTRRLSPHNFEAYGPSDNAAIREDKNVAAHYTRGTCRSYRRQAPV